MLMKKLDRFFTAADLNAPCVSHKARSKKQLKRIAQKKLRKALDRFLIV
jgi:hypothetical protein